MKRCILALAAGLVLLTGCDWDPGPTGYYQDWNSYDSFHHVVVHHHVYHHTTVHRVIVGSRPSRRTR